MDGEKSFWFGRGALPKPPSWVAVREAWYDEPIGWHIKPKVHVVLADISTLAAPVTDPMVGPTGWTEMRRAGVISTRNGLTFSVHPEDWDALVAAFELWHSREAGQ